MRAAAASVKSTTTSAPAVDRDSRSPETTNGGSIPSSEPRSELESRGSTAATNSKSSAPVTAKQTSWPMRPPAPTTPTRTMART